MGESPVPNSGEPGGGRFPGSPSANERLLFGICVMAPSVKRTARDLHFAGRSDQKRLVTTFTVGKGSDGRSRRVRVCVVDDTVGVSGPEGLRTIGLTIPLAAFEDAFLDAFCRCVGWSGEIPPAARNALPGEPGA